MPRQIGSGSNINVLSVDELITFVRKHKKLSLKKLKEVIIDHINTELVCE